MNARWMTVCHSSTSVPLVSMIVRASMKLRSRWIEEMPMIDMASLVLSTFALTCESHSGWSGWPSSLMRDTNVS